MPASPDDTVSSGLTGLYSEVSQVSKGSCVRSEVLRHWNGFPSRSGVSVLYSHREVFVLWSDRSGRVYRGRSVPGVLSAGGGLKMHVARFIWSEDEAMKRKTLSRKGPRVHALDKELALSHPLLHEWMTAAVWEGSQEVRLGPTVTVWATNGEFRAAVKDRAEGLVMWLSAPSWSDLWQMCNDFCQSSEAPWREDDSGSPEKGKRIAQSGRKK